MLIALGIIALGCGVMAIAGREIIAILLLASPLIILATWPRAAMWRITNRRKKR